MTRLPGTFCQSTGGYGYRQSADPEEHGGLDAGFVTLAAVWMGWDVWGHQPMCCTSCRAGSILPARRHTRADRQDYGFPRHRKQMWNSAITEPGAGSDVGSRKRLIPVEMVRFILMVVSVLYQQRLHPVHRGDGARRGFSGKPVYTEWFVDMSKPGIKVTNLKSSVCVWIAAVKSLLTTWTGRERHVRSGR